MLGDEPNRRFDHQTRSLEDIDAAHLAELRAATSTSVSVVLPARDEEATVGAIVAAIRRDLQIEVPLVDEILVVDADSDDATAATAREAGARVVRQSEVLPEAGSRPGKGEALWKGLAASDGDIVVFIDADIVDFDTRFVSGLLAPLLIDPDLALSKATYDRPFHADGAHSATGGGRVTELLARPLIATFWPELSWLAQPLSGEYAARREVLEHLPFVCGYGVELAMLLDVVEQHGPDRIVQVDLGRRIHDHQSLAALGRMSTEILHVALDRLERQQRVMLTDPMARRLDQPVRTLAGDLALETHRVDITERPPLANWRRTEAVAT